MFGRLLDDEDCKVHVRKDDTVMAIAGKDHGKKGKVLRVFAGRQRVIVEGLNLVKKHVRPNPAKQEQGGIIQKEASIHVSNVMLCCPRCNEPTRVGKKTLEDGTKMRYCSNCQEMI